MKKLLLIILLSCFLLTGCTSYKGYWCSYKEEASIIILLENDITEKQKNTIESLITDYDNLSSYTYYDKDDYGITANDGNVYAAYYVSFTNSDNISDYLNLLNYTAGVYQASEDQVKTNISLYNFTSNKKYTYTNSDEALAEDLENGTYKIKNGVITLKDENGKTKMLYIKDNHLCAETTCDTVYFKSNSTCTTNND